MGKTSSQSSNSGCNPLILIYTRQLNFSRFLHSLLSGEGFEICATSDDKELFEILDSKKDCALFILDIAAGADAEGLLARLAEHVHDLSMLVLASGQSEESVLKYLKYGAADFISKPFDIGDFVFTVRDVISRSVDDNMARGINVRSALKGWVELTAVSSYEYVARFQKFTSLLFESEVGDDVKDDIRMAIDELGRNAVEWGNRHDPTKRIHLSYCLFSDRLIFRIEDEGEGFDTSALSDPDADPLDVINRRLLEGKRSGGFGTGIAHRIMDDVQYNEKGNVVFLTKHLKAES